MPYLMPNGYLQIHRYIGNGKTKKVYEHREIWEKYFGKISNGYDIHHKNGNRSDNRIDNLESIEKHKHHVQHGNHWLGRKHTMESILKMRKVKLGKKPTQKQLDALALGRKRRV